MSNSPGSEKRQFVRVPVDVEVKYRFIRSGDGAETSATPLVPRDSGSEGSLSGKTANIGAGGLLLVAALPKPDLIADLLMGKVSVGLELLLPEHEPIRAIARVAWLESLDETTNTCAIGLRFSEITASAQDELFRYVINAVEL